ncbi:Hypothetical protein FKW44_018051, partial [Caligus rogercresseyi]
MSKVCDLEVAFLREGKTAKEIKEFVVDESFVGQGDQGMFISQIRRLKKQHQKRQDMNSRQGQHMKLTAETMELVRSLVNDNRQFTMDKLAKETGISVRIIIDAILKEDPGLSKKTERRIPLTFFTEQHDVFLESMDETMLSFYTQKGSPAQTKPEIRKNHMIICFFDIKGVIYSRRIKVNNGVI